MHKQHYPRQLSEAANVVQMLVYKKDKAPQTHTKIYANTNLERTP